MLFLLGLGPCSLSSLPIEDLYGAYPSTHSYPHTELFLCFESNLVLLPETTLTLLQIFLRKGRSKGMLTDQLGLYFQNQVSVPP